MRVGLWEALDWIERDGMERVVVEMDAHVIVRAVQQRACYRLIGVIGGIWFGGVEGRWRLHEFVF
ncbi:hypothetical protein A2U01_0010168 [Trifolium medium]|uniref:Uncharacterized protein n=1 Tax=Trifolium medium TaxID=97028 RepID=A0A392MSN1_9FABA|nr:hypothetical protein [Trifolium medium]